MKKIKKNTMISGSPIASGSGLPGGAKAESSTSAIAIIGMAFRFPGDLADEDSFWNALREGRELIGEVPAERWAVNELQHDRRGEPGRSITFSAGVLSRIDEFDADFFGISPREAAWLDPQQRLLLELAYESMENAGVAPSSLAGSDCAVYVGISGLDYGVHAIDDLAGISAHMMTGNTLSTAANRLSYVYDLRGPSLAVDTACSSSLVALHHACNSILWGESSLALVGGVHLLLHPYPFIGFTKAAMLAEDGRCKPFDASANGYVRSEGGAVLLLKGLERAVADGDAVQAVILASGVNADGARKTGITIPSVEGQSDLMRLVLSRSGLKPHEIDFIEAHGTGTAVGDPVEAAAIGEVYGQGRKAPLRVGSVKANLGHLEPASGMASLVKAVLALKRRALPPSINLSRPNPKIDFKGCNLEVVTRYQELGGNGAKPLVAGVNSFGFGGANAHVLLREFRPAGEAAKPPLELPLEPLLKSSPEPSLKSPLGSSLDGIAPLFLSARNAAALEAVAAAYAALLEGKTAQEYYDIAFAAAGGRDRLDKRLAVSAGDAAEAALSLSRYASGVPAKKLYVEDRLPEGGGVAFVYSGNGSQWRGMGLTLLEQSPRFAAILEEMDRAMLAWSGFSLLQELRAGEENSRLDSTEVAQPLIFAIQVGVTLLLREQGVQPAAVAGHSVGEVAAAWAAGALDLNQAIRIICARSKAQGLARGCGRMAAAALSRQAAQDLLDELGLASVVEIAGINSPGDVTLSGGLDDLMEIGGHVESRGRFFKLLDIDYAFHSRGMDAIRQTLDDSLEGLRASPCGKALFVSAVTGDVLEGAALGPEYWWRNVRFPVRFADAVTKLADTGCRIFVEIGPNAILQHYIRACLTEAGVRGRVLSSLRKKADGFEKIAETALRVHLLEDSPDTRCYFPCPGKRVRLPNYPWQREPHWHPKTGEALRSFEKRRAHPLLGWPAPHAEAVWENTLDPASLPWLAGHMVGGSIVFPGAAYVEMALAAARECFGTDRFAVEELDIVAPLLFDAEQARSLRFSLNRRDGGFQIQSRPRLSADEWSLHAAGRLLEATGAAPAPGIDAPPDDARQIDPIAHYALASALGLDYGSDFQRLEKAVAGENRLEGNFRLSDIQKLDDYVLYPGLLDVCYQSLLAFFPEEAASGYKPAFLPIKTGRLDVYRRAVPSRFRAVLRRRGVRSLLADFELLDAGGGLIARASACRFRAARLQGREKNSVSSWRIVPRPQPHPADSPACAQWPAGVPSDIVLEGLACCGRNRPEWFRQTLPLFEALALAFSYEAARELAREHPSGWHEFPDSPHGQWLLWLLAQEGLVVEKAGQWLPAEDVDLPPAAELWRSLLSAAPHCLPQLLRMGRVGRHLPALLKGEADGAELLEELCRSPIAEALYNDDAAYVGTRVAAESLLRHLAGGLPQSRRLRVLEITAGMSALPGILQAELGEDRFDYVLALPDAALQERQQARCHEQANVRVEALSLLDWEFAGEAPGAASFDLVILRHSLHCAGDPLAALERVRQWLAPQGLLFLAERYPDWSADFVDGIGPFWWREEGETSGQTVLGRARSSLLPPEAWNDALVSEGFEASELFREPASDTLAEGAYVLLARRPEAEELVPPMPEPASWLFLADEASLPVARRLGSLFESLGQRVAVSDANGQRLSQAGGQSASLANDNLIFMLGWRDTPEQAGKSLAHLLQSVQEFAADAAREPRLWIITRGGALAAPLPEPYEPSAAQAALWGFGRVVMNEFPAFGCTLIDVMDMADLAPDGYDEPDEPFLARLANELLLPDGNDEILLAQDARYCLRMREEKRPRAGGGDEEGRFRLDFHTPGQLRNLLWLAESESPLRDDEVEVRTRAAGLNFRDVMYVMGLLPDEAVESGFAGASLGLEFSGVVSGTGRAVRDLKPGDAVMGFGASCFASHVRTRADAVARMPEDWSFEAAATVPTVFFTVYYALKHLADLQKGEKVLIHGAAGGVGIAAVQLARHLGAEVFATAGSGEKRDFVRLLGADHVLDSRSLSFADDLLAATDGEGVDVVLNSLAGEAMRRSLGVLKSFGRFLELGKRDFFENTPLGLRPFKNNISYNGIDADQLLNARPQLAARLFSEVMELFEQGILAPLPYRVFSADLIGEAFRTMQQSRHIGKVVISFADARPELARPCEKPADVAFGKNDCWLITGGLSGFGLESARWLAARGVGNLILVNRRGASTPGAGEIIDDFSRQGVNALALSCDISDPDAVHALVEQAGNGLPPLSGVLHAAAAFDDKLISRLDARSLEAVLRPKLLGAWHLHQATLGLPIRHFVLYSSVSAAIGNPGQANYVAANAGLESLAAKRRRMGLPGTCIAWGPIGDAGYLARNESVRDSLEQRLGSAALSSAEALALLDGVFAHAGGQSILANFDWRVLSRLLPSPPASRFAAVNRNVEEHGVSVDAYDMRALLAEKSPREFALLAQDLIRQEVAQTLCIDAARIDPDRPLHDLGMDSLMAVELAIGLERKFGVQLPVMALNDAPSVVKVAALIGEKLFGTCETDDADAVADSFISDFVRQHGMDVADEDFSGLAEDARALAKNEARLVE